MQTFEKDIRPIALSLIWSWILIFIPTVIMYLSWARTTTKLEGGIVQQTTGAISKTFHTIDLYRVRNVSATDSPFTGGRVLITNPDGTQVLRYIKNPEQAVNAIRERVDAEREKRGIRSREDI